MVHKTIKRLSESAQKNQSGFILPLFLITVIIIATILVTISTTVTLDYKIVTRETHKLQAQLAADAAIDKAIVLLNADSTYTGTGGEITLLNSTDYRTTYEATVSAGGTATKKIINVVGRTYAPTTSTTPSISRKYQMDVEAVTSGNGPSSVVAGVGGLQLNNNAKITGGDVLVNGTVTLSNNAQIGLTTNSVNVRVAHTNCPNPATAAFPRVCGSGENGQPISMGTNARIYANVQATNQTTGTNMFNPGLILNSTVAPVALPVYDRAAQKALAGLTPATNLTGATGSCSTNNGSITWQANTKITGNVTFANNCTITVNGNVWITGNLTMGNNSRIVVANSLGTTRPVIMVDGSTGVVFGNNSVIAANSSNTGVQIIAYYSLASCSPDCADVTGSDLKNSQSVRTIDLSNNGSAPYTVLWSAWTKVRVQNNGQLGAVTGQTVELSNNAVINFTSSVPGSDNLVTTWVKRGYMRNY